MNWLKRGGVRDYCRVAPYSMLVLVFELEGRTCICIHIN